jgi:hypothetical protein
LKRHLGAEPLLKHSRGLWSNNYVATYISGWIFIHWPPDLCAQDNLSTVFFSIFISHLERAVAAAPDTQIQTDYMRWAMKRSAGG